MNPVSGKRLCKVLEKLGWSLERITRSHHIEREDVPMATVEKSTALDPEVLADLEAACNAKGVVRDPELYRRITERADRVRQETLEKFGVQEIDAEVLRTLHDE